VGRRKWPPPGLRGATGVTEVDDGSLPDARRIAVRDAVREACENTMNKPATTEVVLRVEHETGASP